MVGVSQRDGLDVVHRVDEADEVVDVEVDGVGGDGLSLSGAVVGDAGAVRVRRPDSAGGGAAAAGFPGVVESVNRLNRMNRLIGSRQSNRQSNRQYNRQSNTQFNRQFNKQYNTTKCFTNN